MVREKASRARMVSVGGIGLTGARAHLKDGDLDGDDHARLILGPGVVLLAEHHDVHTLGRRKGRERRDGQRSGKSKARGLGASRVAKRVRVSARRETRAGRCRRARCAPSAPVGRRDTHEVSDARSCGAFGRSRDPRASPRQRHPTPVSPAFRSLRFTACVRGKRRKIAPWHQAPDRWEGRGSPCPPRWRA